MVSIGSPLCPIWAVVIKGYGLYGPYGLWLTACTALAKGCVVSTLAMGISNRREIPCATQSRRSTMNWRMAWRNVVGAASQIHRE